MGYQKKTLNTEQEKKEQGTLYNIMRLEKNK